MTPSSIGIVGYGQFGQFVHQLAAQYLSAVDVRVYSRRATPGTDSFVDLATVAQADVVILCGAISEFAEQLALVQQYARPDTIIVDVATVKQHTEATLQAAQLEQPYVASHPMFGPASYAKCGHSVTGLRLVITSHTLPPAVFAALEVWLAELGIVVITMTAAEHDRYLAETLFLTHLVAQTMTEAAFVRTEIDTVSFGYLMDAVESVRDDTRLFAEVYKYNTFCRAVSDRFARAEAAVHDRLAETEQ